jgi:hypothetical protein
MTTHLCPRRAELPPNSPLPDGEDTWIDGRTCSFCGSISGDAFMLLVRKGAVIDPTDKSYKAYIQDRGTDPEEGPRPVETGFSKFYFQHLSEEQQRAFVGLCNAGTVRLGWPGRFYVWPFFMTVVPR